MGTLSSSLHRIHPTLLLHYSFYLIFIAFSTLLQEINDQKLIYSGKLLSDEQKLSEVIRSYKDVYQQHHIFHLVCANKNITKTPHKMTTTTTVPVKETNANANATANTPQGGMETNTNDNELRQRHVASAAAAAAATAQLPYQQQQQQLPQLSQHANAAYSWMQFLQPTGPQQVAANSAHHLAFQQQQQQQAMMYNAWVQQWYAAYMQQMMQR